MKRDRLAWPILLLLLTVLIPSAGVMWMMREAVRNERAATNQRLLEAYRLQLEQAAEKVKDGWDRKFVKMSGRIDDQRLASSFAKIVAANTSVDSVILCDQWGGVLYPEIDRSIERVESKDDSQWQAASHLEFVEGDYLKAATAYDQVIEGYELPTHTLAAVLAKARCLDKAGERKGAVIETLQSVSHFRVVGAGESHRCAAYLRLLEVADNWTPTWKVAASQLKRRLVDYEKFPLRSHERRFLTKQYQKLTDDFSKFPTYDAESLAIKFVEQLKDGTIKLPAGLRKTSLADVWQNYSKESKLAALYRTETVRKTLLNLCEELPLPEGVAFSAAAPGEAMNHLVDVSLGPKIGDWQLGLRVTDGNPFSESSKQQNAVYVWIAALTVAATCVLAWLLLAALRRRMKVAQLKNDLVATVSHELKTPLASIRLLVDTLLENDDQEARVARAQQTTEYLQLISAENTRLSRLIDNFLTFSRMEQGRKSYDVSVVDVGTLIEKAVGVFRDHCPEASKCLSVDVQEVANVSCDSDSMVTAIVNLLENAWKYGGDEKKINLSVGVKNGWVEISVCDDGIGLAPRELNRVFERFYQVDQRVARTHGGCGLGLSIVRSIIEAHGGTVSVKSKPDVGSTFTIRLPRSK